MKSSFKVDNQYMLSLSQKLHARLGHAMLATSEPFHILALEIDIVLFQYTEHICDNFDHLIGSWLLNNAGASH